MASFSEFLFFAAAMVTFAMISGVAIGIVGSIAWYTFQWVIG